MAYCSDGLFCLQVRQVHERGRAERRWGEAEGQATSISCTKTHHAQECNNYPPRKSPTALRSGLQKWDNTSWQHRTNEEKLTRYLHSSFILSHKHSRSLPEWRPGVSNHVLSLVLALQIIVNCPHSHPCVYQKALTKWPIRKLLPNDPLRVRLSLKLQPQGKQYFCFFMVIFSPNVFLTGLISGYVNSWRYPNSWEDIKDPYLRRRRCWGCGEE